MQELPSTIRAGQQVEARDEPWMVVETEHFDDTTLLTLRGIGPENLGQSCGILVPFDRVRTIVARSGIARRGRHAALRTAADLIVRSPRWRDCWTAGAARIDLRPWQLEPALAVLGGATRILLADQVGLGKTIQAALIVSELMARALASRVLVLTPASLREQWAAELSGKFGLAVTVFDPASLVAATAALPAGVNPWSSASLVVSSIDLVKRPEIRAALDLVPLDVLVVDEAHHLTPGSDRGAVAADLAGRTPWVVLATATPHSGDEAAYRFLRSLGDPAGRGDLVTYRRTARQVRGVGARRTRLLAITPTAAERALLDATLAYVRTLWQDGAAHPGAQLLATVIARRAASSASAAGATLQRRLHLIQGEPSAPRQTPLPWDEGESGDVADDDSLLGVPGFSNPREEVAWLEHLIHLAGQVAVSSKIAALRRLLRRTTERVIVFSEYRDVVQTVAPALADLGTVAVLHGGLAASARQTVIRSFVHGDTRVLVTTDTAGEGLNLEPRCRLVVNFELPWSPLRLEQRSGRVDRIGQTRRVHTLHLVHRGSFEETVLARLEWRRTCAAAELPIDDGALGEREVAAAVLGGKGISLPPSVILPPAPATVANSCQTSVLAERRLRSLARRGPTDGLVGQPVYASASRRRQPAESVLLLFTGDLIDGHGRLLQREVVALQVQLAPSHALRELHRDLLLPLVNHHVLQDLLRTEMDRRASIARADSARFAAGIQRRAADLAGALGRHGAQLVQGSLFDRRREQQAQLRADAIAGWQAHLARRMNGASALTQIETTTPRFVAAWLW